MQKQYREPDYILIAVTAVLVLIGLLMILSASFNFTYLQKQFLSLIIGFTCFIMGYLVDYHWYKRIVMPLSIFTVFLLSLTYIPGLGHTAGGASRWINLGGLIFQPSELAKISLIFFVAMSLENKGQMVKDFRKGILPIIIAGGLIIGLVLKQPDLGTSVLLSAIVGLMLFVGGAQIWQLLILGAVGFRAAIWWIAQNPYQKDRVLAFLDPWEHYLGIGFHTVQSLLAVGSGGLFGLGLGYSRQKFSYLPQPFTDFIYAIISEELGFMGAVLVLVLFMVFTIRGVRIARLAPDRFGMLVAFGITCWIIIEALLNIGVVLGVLPPTGIPLIFISFGGSSLMSALFAVGILVNISRQIDFSHSGIS